MRNGNSRLGDVLSPESWSDITWQLMALSRWLESLLTIHPILWRNLVSASSPVLQALSPFSMLKEGCTRCLLTRHERSTARLYLVYSSRRTPPLRTFASAIDHKLSTPSSLSRSADRTRFSYHSVPSALNHADQSGLITATPDNQLFIHSDGHAVSCPTD